MGLFSKKKGNTEQRSTVVEEPKHLLPSDAISLNFLNSFMTLDAMGISSVFAAIEMISNSIAVLPIKISKSVEGGKDDIYDHPFLTALKTMKQSKFVFMKKLITDMLLYGNGFAYIKRTGDGSVKELVYCESRDVTVVWDKPQQKLYYLCPIVAQGRIEPVNMLHFYKNSSDGYLGVGILTYANDIIKLAGVTNASAENFFTSGCNVNGVLTYTGTLSDKQKQEIRLNWQQTHSGEKASGVAVLPGGMSYQQTGSSANDSQLLESRTYNNTEIARFFNISPTLLGDLSHSSYNTLEAAQQEYVVHTLMPYITMIESEFNRKILKPSEFDLTIDLDESYILRADKQATASYYNTFVQNGVLSVNEVRAALGYAPIDGGDDHRVAYTDLSQNTIESQKDSNTDNGEQ